MHYISWSHATKCKLDVTHHIPIIKRKSNLKSQKWILVFVSDSKAILYFTNKKDSNLPREENKPQMCLRITLLLALRNVQVEL